jgi:hypothetical protein
MNEIITQLREVWGRHNEFRENGIEYVCWVIRRQCNEMESDNYEESECVKEFADIILVSARELDELGYDVKEVVLDRLNTRMRGKTDAIIAKEARLWKGRTFKE